MSKIYQNNISDNNANQDHPDHPEHHINDPDINDID